MAGTEAPNVAPYFLHFWRRGQRQVGTGPADLGPVITAVLDDTCGNLIQIVSPK